MPRPTTRCPPSDRRWPRCWRAPRSSRRWAHFPAPPASMAPEQMRGARANARSDLFAFCTAFYEAVAGTRPYPGKNFGEMRNRAESERIEPPQRPVPRWLRRELRRGLKADPIERHPSMDALLAAIEKGRSGRRRIWIASAAALGGLAAALGLRPHKPGPPRAGAGLDPP